MGASADVVGDGGANAFVGATSNYGITGDGGAPAQIGGNTEIDAEVDNIYGSTASSTTGNASALTNTQATLMRALVLVKPLVLMQD